MTVFADLPCTDADIAEVALGDFPTLVSRSERLAYGEDGSIDPASFVLESDFPFETQGIEVGHVAVLETHQVNGRAQRIDGGTMPVAAVTDGSLTLRRVGYESGKGAYAGPPGGGTGIRFFVPTLLAQIRTASAEVRRKLGLASDTALNSSDDLRLVTILMVLHGLYFAAYRTDEDDVFKSKMGDLAAQIEALMGTLAKIYQPHVDAQAGSTHGPQVAAMDSETTWRLPYIY